MVLVARTMARPWSYTRTCQSKPGDVARQGNADNDVAQSKPVEIDADVGGAVARHSRQGYHYGRLPSIA